MTSKCVVLGNSAVLDLSSGVLLITWLPVGPQWDHQQLHLHADGVRSPGSQHLAAQPQVRQPSGQEVLLEEHAGGCAHHPQTRWGTPWTITVAPDHVWTVIRVVHTECVLAFKKALSTKEQKRAQDLEKMSFFNDLNTNGQRRLSSSLCKKRIFSFSVFKYRNILPV